MQSVDKYTQADLKQISQAYYSSLDEFKEMIRRHIQFEKINIYDKQPFLIWLKINDYDKDIENFKKELFNIQGRTFVDEDDKIIDEDALYDIAIQILMSGFTQFHSGAEYTHEEMDTTFNSITQTYKAEWDKYIENLPKNGGKRKKRRTYKRQTSHKKRRTHKKR